MNTHDYSYATIVLKNEEKFRNFDIEVDSVSDLCKINKPSNHNHDLTVERVKADLCILFHRAVVKKSRWYTLADVPVACWGGGAHKMQMLLAFPYIRLYFAILAIYAHPIYVRTAAFDIQTPRFTSEWKIHIALYIDASSTLASIRHLFIRIISNLQLLFICLGSNVREIE